MPAASDHTPRPASATSAVGASPDAPLFHERVLPGPGAWLICGAVGGALGLILVPLNLVAAVVVTVVAIAVLVVTVVMYSPVIEVAGGRYRLGRALIEVELLGDPVPMKGEDWAKMIGQDFEPLAHHCVRGWTRTGLRVEIVDEDDPTTAWVASTRRPDDLALALRTAQKLQAQSPA